VGQKSTQDAGIFNGIELGIGTWQWGDRMMWGYGRGYGDTDLREAFDASLEAGITFFDTAEAYGWGRSERILGGFAKEAGRQLVIATKYIPFPWRLRKLRLSIALRDSLARLGMDTVDLYQIHQPFPPMPVTWWADALADAVGAGLARAVGVSNYSPAQMERARLTLAKRGTPLASNQVNYSLLDRRSERNGLLAACLEHNITLIAYSPIAKGVLSGKYTPDNPPPGLRRRIYGGRLAAIQPLIGLLREIGSAHGAAHGGKTPAQVALNWVICKGALPIVGVKNAQQVRDNVGAMGWRLAADEVAALDAASEGIT
jgi:aryl-alcohol dehydrogenase-like predicted oxidoreductase